MVEALPRADSETSAPPMNSRPADAVHFCKPCSWRSSIIATTAAKTAHQRVAFDERNRLVEFQESGHRNSSRDPAAGAGATHRRGDWLEEAKPYIRGPMNYQEFMADQLRASIRDRLTEVLAEPGPRRK
jgi:hypothetical protein